MCFRKKKKLELLERSKEVVFKKLSVENMIEKFFKVDHLAQMVLSENQMKEYNHGDRVLFDNEMKTFTINKKFIDQQEDLALSEYNKSNFSSEKDKKNVHNTNNRQITL
jgi:tRNA U55 pseudouridine synthase TruB